LFPIAGESRAVSATRDREVAAARVLVVEDEAHVRDGLVTLLAQHGHVALAAADGREGLTVVQREPVDVVFVDLSGPAPSALDLARAVKRIRPGTPVILVTAWPGQLDAAALRESGVDRVIEKPLRAQTALAALDIALGVRRAATP
jgi:DNA-binding response OmpR family regulator